MHKQRIFLIIFIVAVLVGGGFGESSPKSAPTPHKGPPFANLTKQEVGTIVRVVDGDTIIVEIGGKQERVRLLGVNTPESVDPRRNVECFGFEAARFARGLLPPHTTVRLISDPTQTNRDQYGRLLRYVFLTNDTFVNQEILANGYGYEYTYNTPYQYQTDFKTTEQIALKDKKGLWARGSCPDTKY